jgi:hypothetical protein
VSSFFVVAFAATLALATADTKPYSAPVSRREKGCPDDQKLASFGTRIGK